MEAGILTLASVLLCTLQHLHESICAQALKAWREGITEEQAIPDIPRTPLASSFNISMGGPLLDYHTLSTGFCQQRAQLVVVAMRALSHSIDSGLHVLD